MEPKFSTFQLYVMMICAAVIAVAIYSYMFVPESYPVIIWRDRPKPEPATPPTEPAAPVQTQQESDT